MRIIKIQSVYPLRQVYMTLVFTHLPGYGPPGLWLRYCVLVMQAEGRELRDDVRPGKF